MPKIFYKSKNTYNLHPSLKHLQKIKAVINPHLLPFINFFMKIAFRLKSDNFVNVKKYKITSFQNGKIDVYVIEPKNKIEKNARNDIEGKSPNCKTFKNPKNQKTPAIVLFHGGAFCLRASSSHYKIAKQYACRLCCKVIFADYRLLPKYPFPYALKDCFCAYKWTVENADFLQIDKNKIIIAGDSAGGNLAIGVTLLCKNEKIPLPKATLLIYPVTDKRMLTSSMKTFTDTPVWNAKLNKKMWQMYLKNETVREEEKLPLYSCGGGNTSTLCVVKKGIAPDCNHLLRTTHSDACVGVVDFASPMENENFENFPHTYIEVAEYDCLRDEGIAFAEKLKEADVDVKLVKVEHACHGFETATKSKIVRQMMDRRIDFCENVFTKI